MSVDIFFFLFIIIGIASGTTAGLVGIGGGIILTPICNVIFPHLGVNNEIQMKVIFGTNFFVIVVTALVASFRYYKKKQVNWKAVGIMASFSVIGVIIGITLLTKTTNRLLEQMFAVLALFAAIRLFIKDKRINTKTPRSSHENIILALTGLFPALIGSLLGVGGGIIMIPVMIFLLNYDEEVIPGTSISVIAVTAFCSMIGYMITGWDEALTPSNSIGYVYLDAAIPLSIGAVFGAPLGIWLNEKVSRYIFRKIFAVILVISFFKMFF